MCTVLFFPTKEGYYFASLRDESPKRAKAKIPAVVNNDELSYLAPIDPLGGGSWVGVNENGSVIILLNGGFQTHIREKSYRKSRGLIVTELLTKEMPVVEWSLMDMDGIEPYTLIIFDDGNLFQLVWDGAEKHRMLLENDKPYLWSSATLYDSSAQQIRNDLFQNWIAMSPPITKLTVLNFLKSFENKEIGFLMNRNDSVQTLSYSFIELLDDKEAVMSYYDLKDYIYHASKIEMNRNCSNAKSQN